MMSSDPVAIYQRARTVDADCIDMSRKLDGLYHSSDTWARGRQAYVGALQQCKSAYLDRWSMAHSLEAALDSGGKVCLWLIYEAIRSTGSATVRLVRQLCSPPRRRLELPRLIFPPRSAATLARAAHLQART
jgi:hypothetical protein